MADKTVNIRIDTKANTSGAKDAAKAVDKLTQSTEEAKAATESVGRDSTAAENLTGAFDDLLGRLDTLKESARETREEFHGLGNEVGNAGSAAELAEPKMARMMNHRTVRTAHNLARVVGDIGERMRDTAREFESSSPEVARQLEDSARAADVFSSALTGAAMGASVGGPFGAAVGALVGGMLPELKSAFDDMTSSLAGLAEAEARAEEMARLHADAMNGGLESALAAQEASERLTEAHERETKELERLTEAYRVKNLEQRAKDTADRATRDRADAAEVRGGANPEDVRIRRAEDDGRRDIERIYEDLRLKGEIAQKALDTAREAVIELENLKNTGAADPEQLKQFEQQTQASRDAAERLARDLADARRTAPFREASIQNRTAATVEDQTHRRNQRLQAEAAREAAKQKQQKDREDAAARREAEKEERERARAQQGLDREGESVGRDMKRAAGSAMLTEDDRRRVKEAAENLQGGRQGVDQAAEAVNQVLSMLERLKAGKQEAEAWTAVQKRIRKLEMGFEAQNSVMKKNLGRTGAR